MAKYARTAIALTFLVAASADAQDVRRIFLEDSIEARSDALFAEVTHVRQLAHGGFLVAANGGSRVVLMDPLLASATDVVSFSRSHLHDEARGLIPWAADSSLVVYPDDGPITVVDRFGLPRRSIRTPNARFKICMAGGKAGTPSRGPDGRIVCQMPPDMSTTRPTMSALAAPQVADSSALVRIRLEDWSVDTIAFVRSIPVTMIFADNGAGEFTLAPTIHPLPLVDDWAMLPDGSVAIVRGTDYHVDWVSADGTVVSTAPLPFRSRRLSPDDKVAIVDSARLSLERRFASLHPDRAPVTTAATVDTTRVQAIRVFRPEVARNPRAMAEYAGRLGPLPLVLVAPEALPDSLPPFKPGSVRADLEGNVWIRTNEEFNGGPVYDIIGRNGRQKAKVVLPPGRTIVGFGADGVVITTGNSAQSRLVRARVRL